MRKPILLAITLYQKTLSPDHGPISRFYPNGYCKFYPTCSVYTYEAVDTYGVIKGLSLGFKRVLRCNPFNDGGFDPVKKK